MVATVAMLGWGHKVDSLDSEVLSSLASTASCSFIRGMRSKRAINRIRGQFPTHLRRTFLWCPSLLGAQLIIFGKSDNSFDGDFPALDYNMDVSARPPPPSNLLDVRFDDRWELLKPILEHLFIREKKRFAEIVRIMKADYHFDARWVPRYTVSFPLAT
jgi:hypothetical protein